MSYWERLGKAATRYQSIAIIIILIIIVIITIIKNIEKQPSSSSSSSSSSSGTSPIFSVCCFNGVCLCYQLTSGKRISLQPKSGEKASALETPPLSSISIHMPSISMMIVGY
jgi:hypothetical protein